MQRKYYYQLIPVLPQVLVGFLCLQGSLLSAGTKEDDLSDIFAMGDGALGVKAQTESDFPVEIKALLVQLGADSAELRDSAEAVLWEKRALLFPFLEKAQEKWAQDPEVRMRLKRLCSKMEGASLPDSSAMEMGNFLTLYHQSDEEEQELLMAQLFQQESASSALLIAAVRERAKMQAADKKEIVFKNGLEISPWEEEILLKKLKQESIPFIGGKKYGELLNLWAAVDVCPSIQHHLVALCFYTGEKLPVVEPKINALMQAELLLLKGDISVAQKLAEKGELSDDLAQCLAAAQFDIASLLSQKIDLIMMQRSELFPEVELAILPLQWSLLRLQGDKNALTMVLKDIVEPYFPSKGDVKSSENGEFSEGEEELARASRELRALLNFLTASGQDKQARELYCKKIQSIAEFDLPVTMDTKGNFSPQILGALADTPQALREWAAELAPRYEQKAQDSVEKKALVEVPMENLSGQQRKTMITLSILASYAERRGEGLLIAPYILGEIQSTKPRGEKLAMVAEYVRLLTIYHCPQTFIEMCSYAEEQGLFVPEAKEYIQGLQLEPSLEYSFYQKIVPLLQWVQNQGGVVLPEKAAICRLLTWLGREGFSPVEAHDSWTEALRMIKSIPNANERTQIVEPLLLLCLSSQERVDKIWDILRALETPFWSSENPVILSAIARVVCQSGDRVWQEAYREAWKNESLSTVEPSLKEEIAAALEQCLGRKEYKETRIKARLLSDSEISSRYLQTYLTQHLLSLEEIKSLTMYHHTPEAASNVSREFGRAMAPLILDAQQAKRMMMEYALAGDWKAAQFSAEVVMVALLETGAAEREDSLHELSIMRAFSELFQGAKDIKEGKKVEALEAFFVANLVLSTEFSMEFYDILQQAAKDTGSDMMQIGTSVPLWRFWAEKDISLHREQLKRWNNDVQQQLALAYKLFLIDELSVEARDIVTSVLAKYPAHKRALSYQYRMKGEKLLLKKESPNF